MKLSISNIANRANKWRDFILDLIFPVECLACGQEGSWLCSDCFKRLKIRPKQGCLNCRKTNSWGRFCSRCAKKVFLNGVWIAGHYESKLLSESIKKFKYYFLRDLGAPLGEFLLNFSRGLFLRAGNKKVPEAPLTVANFFETLIIPIPLHRKRLAWRGFNQSEILANYLANYFTLEINSSQLVRIKHQRPQAKLNQQKRRQNVRNCFSWQGEGLAGRNVILIDDVATTGSTLNEAARVLKENGAGEVWGLVLAKG